MVFEVKLKLGIGVGMLECRVAARRWNGPGGSWVGWQTGYFAGVGDSRKYIEQKWRIVEDSGE